MILIAVKFTVQQRVGVGFLTNLAIHRGVWTVVFIVLTFTIIVRVTLMLDYCSRTVKK